MSGDVTWGFLFRRLWRLIVLRFAKQRMCEECGDAFSYYLRDGYRVPVWGCEACYEWRAIQEKYKPKPTPEEIAAQRRFAEMLQGQVGAPIRLGRHQGFEEMGFHWNLQPQQFTQRPSGLLGHIGGALGGSSHLLSGLFGRPH